MDPQFLIIIVALVVSIILHEVAHGYMANWLGDPTARLAGRLTMNPLVHIHPLGSVIIPGLLFFSGSPFLVGWAKPVPYNPYNLSDPKYGEAKVAAAGPGVNILLALVFSLLIRFAEPLGLSLAFVEIAQYIALINILLAFFNLIPVPPLDGSKILLALLPYNAAMQYKSFMNVTERLGFAFTFIFFIVFITVLWEPFYIVISTLFTLFTGTSIPY